MKRTKKIGILIGVLAVVSVITLIVTKTEEHKEEIKNADTTIIAVSADDIESVSWDVEDSSLAFTKGDTWTLDEDENFPVDQEDMTSLLSIFEDFGAAFVIENVEDYSQYGLDDPVGTISFKTADQEYTIELGDFSSMDSQRYVSIGDGNVYLVKTDPKDRFAITKDDLMEGDDIPYFNDVTSITFSGAENYTITKDEDRNEGINKDDKYYTEKDDSMIPLDNTNVESYYNNLSNISLKDYVTYNATDEELESYGLDNPTLTAEITYNDEGEEKTFVIHAGDKVDEDTAYVRIGDSKIIYKIAEEDYDEVVEASYNDLRHDSVLAADISDVKEMEITLDGETYTIKTKNSADETTFIYNDEETESEVSESLSSKLQNLDITEFLDEEADGKEEISIKFTLDNDNYPEINISLYRYDGENCLATMDGETLGLVNRSAAVDLIEAINAIVLKK